MPNFDLQSHSDPLRRRPARRPRSSVARPRPASSCWRCPTTTPSTRRRRGDRGGRRATTCGSSRRSRSRRSTGRAVPANCTSSATGSTTPAPTLLERLARFLADREQRTLRMRGAAARAGCAARRRAARRASPRGRPTDRPPPPRARRASSHPANAQRARAEGHRRRWLDLIRAYLIEGRPAFRLRTPRRWREAIATIHDAGGVAVWAHPFWDVDAGEEVLATIDALPARSGSTASRPSTSPTTERADRAARRRAAPRSACCRPARPTSTAPTTPTSPASAPSSCLRPGEPVLGPIVRSSR